MDVRSLCGGCENVYEIYVQICCTCFCVGLEHMANTLLPWRGVVWFFVWTFATCFLHCVRPAVGGQNSWGSCVGADLVCPMVG